MLLLVGYVGYTNRYFGQIESFAEAKAQCFSQVYSQPKSKISAETFKSKSSIPQSSSNSRFSPQLDPRSNTTDHIKRLVGNGKRLLAPAQHHTVALLAENYAGYCWALGRISELRSLNNTG